MIKLKSVIARNVCATVLHKINKGKHLVYLRDPPLRMLMHAVDRSRSSPTRTVAALRRSSQQMETVSLF